MEKLLGGELVINFALQGHKPICNGGLWSLLIWFFGERPDGAESDLVDRECNWAAMLEEAMDP